MYHGSVRPTPRPGGPPVNLFGQPAHVGRHCGEPRVRGDARRRRVLRRRPRRLEPALRRDRTAAALSLRVLQVRRRVVPAEPVRKPPRAPGLGALRGDPRRRAGAHPLDHRRALPQARPRLRRERDRRHCRRRRAATGAGPHAPVVPARRRGRAAPATSGPASSSTRRRRAARPSARRPPSSRPPRGRSSRRSRRPSTSAAAGCSRDPAATTTRTRSRRGSSASRRSWCRA